MEYAFVAITTTNGKRSQATVAVFEHRHEAEAVVDLIENTALNNTVLVIVEREATEPE